MVRKHCGINQKTGKLNKGYYYTDKVLKSGLKQIKKIPKQSGGTILGSGAYGCIIEPAIACDKNNNMDNKVSKILTEVDSSEISFGKKLLKIDPNNKYFLYVIDSCEIKNNLKNVINKDIIKCRKTLNVNRSAQLYNSLMIKGDMSLNDYTDNYKPDKRTLLKIIAKILLCSQVLLDNKLTHYDIKGANIILRKNKKNKHDVLMIDFGGGFNPENRRDFIYNVVDRNVKYIWPPEVWGLSRKYNEKVPSHLDFMKFSEKVMVYMIGNMFKKYKGIPLIEHMINPDPLERLSIDKCLKYIKSYIDISDLSI